MITYIDIKICITKKKKYVYNVQCNARNCFIYIERGEFHFIVTIS